MCKRGGGGGTENDAHPRIPQRFVDVIIFIRRGKESIIQSDRIGFSSQIITRLYTDSQIQTPALECVVPFLVLFVYFYSICTCCSVVLGLLPVCKRKKKKKEGLRDWNIYRK